MGTIRKFNEMNESIQESETEVMFELGDLDDNVILGSNGDWNFTNKGKMILSYNKNPRMITAIINGDEYKETTLYYKEEGSRYKREIGFVLLKNGEIKYIINMYEPQTALFNDNNVSFVGHEELANINLETGRYVKVYTR